MKKHSFKALTLFLLIFCLLFSQTAIVNAAAESVDKSSADYLQDVINMILEKYNGQITPDQLMQGALKGIFDTMDPYTTYFTPEEADNFMGTISGTFSGIGISMELSGDYIMITKVFSGSPAEKAGLLQGDRIAEVDGTNMVGASLEAASALIMGEAGTSVKLGIIRSGLNDKLVVDIIRAVISINPVTYDIVDGIGYIRLDTFSSNSGAYIALALEQMDNAKITKIILDLRGNPGGEVSQAVAIASRFVPEGVITNLDFKSEYYTDETYRSYLEAPKYKLAVLVDGMSASASEIVAGAIQDTKAGTLIGTKTFGKAKVQGLIPILTPEASAKYEKQLGTGIVDVLDLEQLYGITPTDDEIIGYTKMTIGFYYTPNGRMIDGTGITPDITVEDTMPVSDVVLAGIQKLTRTYKPGLNDGGTDVCNAEKILKVLGYDVGTPDNLLDEKTFTAVKQFQKDMKLWPYGVMDFTTQKALNDAFDGVILKYDMQYAKAIEVLNR
ncbi:MAG: PDZ domain-containing protein [Ruminiclostridium sp.]|nr:PDZ domain-containing protein [Ruminiclostridium sp.]